MFHEMGHTSRLPTLPNEDETIVNIHAPMIFNTLLDLPLDTAFRYAGSQGMTMDEAAIDWLITPNFRSNSNMSCSPTYDIGECYNELQYQQRGHLKYMEIAMIWGWEGLGSIHEEFFEKWQTESEYNYRVERDEYIQFASEALNSNMAPLFHLWGVIPSEDLVDQLESMPKSDEILERLRYYKALVPQTIEEFMEWYNRLYEKAGAAWYEVYDEVLAEFESQNVGQQMVDQIDFIIDKYYGTTSVEDNLKAIKKLTITPNPFKDQLTIDVTINEPGFYSVVLSDQIGNILFHQDIDLTAGNNNLTFDLPSSIPKGLYYFQIMNQDHSLTEKIIKQ